MFVKLPEEDGTLGICGRLNAMYGTRDASSNGDKTYTQHLIKNGFVQGKSSPCVFHHSSRKVRCVVHGDDFTFVDCDDPLNFGTKMLQDQYDVECEVGWDLIVGMTKQRQY